MTSLVALFHEGLSPTRAFFQTYTKDFTKEDLGKLFTYETPEAYRFFARGINTAELEGLPWHRRALKYLQGFFLAFTMRLSPARRVIYGLALVASVIGILNLFQGFGLITVRMPFPLNFVRIGVPGPIFSQGTAWLLIGFLLMNLLVLLEVADRLSLKRDLEVAREIQQAMLPDGMWSGPGVEAFGLTKPANTVGGDFYDILPQPDGRVHRRARGRRRQGQPSRAADGPVPGDAADAGRSRAWRSTRWWRG